MPTSIKISLVTLISGTFLILISNLLFFFHSLYFFHFIIVQSSGWILYCTSMVSFALSKENLTIILKNGFPLKLDHLLIPICSLSIFYTVFLLLELYSLMLCFTIVFIFTLVFMVKLNKWLRSKNKIEQN